MRPGRFHPGNQQILCLGLDRIGAASMRPGRFHPGNQPNADKWEFYELGFNEAGAFPPRKSR